MRLPAQPVSPRPVNIRGRTTPRGLYAHGQKDSSVLRLPPDTLALASTPVTAEWVMFLLPSEGHIPIVNLAFVGVGCFLLVAGSYFSGSFSLLLAPVVFR
jgi:hypothetical protein